MQIYSLNNVTQRNKNTSSLSCSWSYPCLFQPPTCAVRTSILGYVFTLESQHFKFYRVLNIGSNTFKVQSHFYISGISLICGDSFLSGIVSTDLRDSSTVSGGLNLLWWVLRIIGIHCIHMGNIVNQQNEAI